MKRTFVKKPVIASYFDRDPRMSINLRSQLTDSDIEELLDEYAGCVSYDDGWVEGDETTIRQIKREWCLE